MPPHEDFYLTDKPTLRLFTEDPVDSLWEQLSLYESHTLAKRLLEQKADAASINLTSNILEAKAKAISSCIRNARDNINNISKSSTVQVTSNYYGCLWLCAAVAAADPANDADLAKLEKSTKGGHGLQNVADDSGQFPDSEFVYLRETGLLADLLKWSGMNAQTLKNISPKSSIKDFAKASVDDKGLLVSLADLLARIPELKGLYEDILGKKSLCIPLVSDVSRNIAERMPPINFTSKPNVQPPNPGHFRVHLSGTLGMSKTQVDDLGIPAAEFEENPGKDWNAKFTDSESLPWAKSFPTYHSSLAGTWNIWIVPLLGSIQDPLFIHMMALYELSIFARYRPAVWHEILEGSYDQYRILIQSYLRLFSRLGPELALTKLIDRNVLVIPPGGLFGPG
ncbi:MAG: YaaC family protein [Candidatus Obscuribacterales bacterium]|nr:YaaC family protein [Candidatus Obscuribacterales bacterium]